MNKLLIPFIIALVLSSSLVGCKRTRYELGRKIDAPKDAPAYTQHPNANPAVPQ